MQAGEVRPRAIDGAETGLRDQLAVERTHLANERTLLAYIRTALASAAGGAVLLQFFPSYPALFGLAWLLVLGGGAMLAVGVYRFLKVRGELSGQVNHVPPR